MTFYSFVIANNCEVHFPPFGKREGGELFFSAPAASSGSSDPLCRESGHSGLRLWSRFARWPLPFGRASPDELLVRLGPSAPRPWASPRRCRRPRSRRAEATTLSPSSTPSSSLSPAPAPPSPATPPLSRPILTTRARMRIHRRWELKC
jgi:hypothetical protein